MSEQLDPDFMLHCSQPVYVKNTDVKAYITGYTISNGKCLVKVHFNYCQSKPCKTCFQLAEQINVDKAFAYTDSCGPQMYLNSEVIYTAVYDIKNLSAVPFGGPAAQLLYGNN